MEKLDRLHNSTRVSADANSDKEVRIGANDQTELSKEHKD